LILEIQVYGSFIYIVGTYGAYIWMFFDYPYA